MTEKPPWELGPEEQRTLVITFVGGLGSIIAGAAVVGSALALARLLERWHPPWGIWLGLAVFTLLDAQLMYWVLSNNIAFRKRQAAIYRTNDRAFLKRQRETSPGYRPQLAITGILWQVFGVLLLTWIGLAAGVK
jgi:hypothetical protein